ncbi:putative Fungal N-terminal domain-containing protein [Seiridium cardinale]
MADPLSVAASVAGLVSLGLQVSSGIIQYLDAIKCRAEELDVARRYVQSIKSTLEVINGFPSRLQAQHQQSLAAISACLKPCEDELSALETLIAKLSNSGNADPDLIDRVRERTKKLAYSFNRTKLSQLEEKLNRTVKALQLAVQSLGIEISATATDSLRTIETTTARSATELLTVKTGVAAIDNGVSVIGRELPVVRSVVQSIVPELGLRTDSLSIQLRQGNEVLRDDISRTGGSINMTMTMVQNELSGIQQTLKTQQQQNAELMRILQRQPNFLALFGTQDQHNMTPTTLLGRAISKPSNLRALCDGFESRQGVVPLRSTDQERPRIQRGTAGADTSEILPFRTTRCAICGFRTQRKMRRKQISYGSIHLYSDTTEYQKHLPNCTYFQPTKMKEQTWGLLRTGAAWFLKQAVQISFSMTSGAGGFSLSPVFTYSATVDEMIAPAFQVVESMINFFIQDDFDDLHNGKEAAQRILEAGFIKVGRLLREGLASPKDVNSRNQTLMEPISSLTWAVAMADLDDSNNIALDFLEKFLNYDIPVAQYDIYGSRRSKIRFIKGLKNRRERLEKLALENLSDLDKSAMALGSGHVLDIRAARVVELLMEKGIKIPAALTPGETLNIQVLRKSWGSVYHSICDADHAELFFNCGFHDLDKPSDEGLPPLAMKGNLGLMNDIPYFKWLIDHGADPFRLLYPTSARYGTILASATSVHHLYWVLGEGFSWSLYQTSGWEYPQSLASLHSIVPSQTPVDECQCNCSQQGCTPSLLMLKGVLRWAFYERVSLPRLIDYYFSRYLRFFWSDLGPVHLMEAVRCLTFCALEIKHTCSHQPDIWSYNFWERERKSEEEIEHIQDEEAEVICLLEQLICEFEEKIDNILENDSAEPDGIIAFWNGYWLDRMQEEIEKLAGNNVPDDQRRGAEELGVKWHDSVYASDSKPAKEPKTVEDFLRELDEIVPD